MNLEVPSMHSEVHGKPIVSNNVHDALFYAIPGHHMTSRSSKEQQHGFVGKEINRQGKNSCRLHTVHNLSMNILMI